MDLPLPEITVEDFERVWTQFELVANAKDWNANKRKVNFPTLLRGKLVDIYMTIDDETRDLQDLKNTDASCWALQDPLTASQSFMSCREVPGEKVKDFATDLKKLFVESYPNEQIMSAILLQQFLTGLSPAISRQLLLNGKPTTFERAIADASDIEFAFVFEPSQEEQ